MNRDKIIYSAGLFDGEGCITIRLNRPTEKSKHKSDLYALVIKVTMTDKKTVNYLYDLFGVGHFRLSNVKSEKRKSAWSWTCMSGDAVFVLNKISPYLITKKREAKIAIDFSGLPSARGGRRRVSRSLLSKRNKLYLSLRRAKEQEIYE